MTVTLDILSEPVNPPSAGARPERFTLERPGIHWAGIKIGLNPDTTCLDLLLLHGTAGSSHCWQPVIEALDAPMAILAPDLPGHGDSRCERHGRHGLDEMARDIAELLTALGLRRVRLIAGHSAGAAVALALALADRPSHAGTPPVEIDQILGIAPSLVPPPLLYTLLLGPALAPMVASTPSVLTATMLTRRTGLTDRLLDSTGSTIADVQREGYRRLLGEPRHLRGAIDFMAATDLPGLLRRLPRLSVPARFLIAPDDRWISARRLDEELARWLPQAGVERCPGGHLLPESQPRQTARLIQEMIEATRP